MPPEPLSPSESKDFVNWGGPEAARREASAVDESVRAAGAGPTQALTPFGRLQPERSWLGMESAWVTPAAVRCSDITRAVGLPACRGCGSGASRLPFGCLFGLRDVFCFLRCMVTVRLRRRCHYKSRPTGVNPDSWLHVTNVGELRRSELSGSVGSTRRAVWCCPWGVGAHVWCCCYQWQGRAAGS